MKKGLLFTTFLSLYFTVSAQLILFRDFNGNSAPGWQFSNGSGLGPYENFNNNCLSDIGILTPGVGGNNPAKILSEVLTPNQRLVEVKFTIDRYNANLKCNTHSDFGCNTYVDILAVASSYSGTNPIGDGAVIYANNSGYLLPIAGGTVTIIINMPATLPTFKLFFNFTVQDLNCNQTGTKYVLDNFRFTGLPPCSIPFSCPPVANTDFFLSGAQGFDNSTLFANVYGTNLAYTPPPAHVTYTKRSLTHPSITPTGGNDYDIDNHPQDSMTFSLISTTFVPADATFIFNADGTFSFLRLNTNKNQFFFTYRITDPQGAYSQAVVRIDYSPGGPLPVKLIDFTAVKRNNKTLLNWKTTLENNNKGFDILRKTSGAFEKIGFVASKTLQGNSNEMTSYSYEDVSIPDAKVVYYRLVQVDIDGKQFYSDIRIISNGDAKQPVLVYPNPSRGNLQIIIPDEISGTVSINIFGATGSLVQTIGNTADKRINVSGLQPGIYTVKVLAKTDNSSFINKLMVQ